MHALLNIACDGICCFQGEDLQLVLNTTTAATTKYTQAMPYFHCAKFDSEGTESRVTCVISNTSACAQPGVVGCTLHYKDINVTSSLKVNKNARLCNTAWASYAAFYKVAYINGSILAPYTGLGGVNGSSIPETEAMALLQLLKAVDADVTSSWAVLNQAAFGHDHSETLKTPEGFDVRFCWRSNYDNTWLNMSEVDRLHVIFVSVSVTNGPTQPMLAFNWHPTLNNHMVTALLNLPELMGLHLTVSEGVLLPQLGSLTKMTELIVNHFCLRGRFPASLLVS
jgi:hypothetical protein